jgi:hypothetical protein
MNPSRVSHRSRRFVNCIIVLVLVVLTGVSVVAQSSTQKRSGVRQQRSLRRSNLNEQFSFFIKDFKIDHQSQLNTLNISVRYTYAANIAIADYPDFRLVEKDIETLLTTYPNKTDYWEIVNKQLTAMVLKKYPAVSRVTIEIEVSPSSVVPFLRSSTVTRTRAQE